MIDPIQNQPYQEYNPNRVAPKPSNTGANGEKFSLDYADEGVLYEPFDKETDAKTDRAKKESSGSFRQAAALELSELSGSKETPAEKPAGGQFSLTDTLRAFFNRAVTAIKKLWHIVWESTPKDAENAASTEDEAMNAISAEDEAMHAVSAEDETMHAVSETDEAVNAGFAVDEAANAISASNETAIAQTETVLPGSASKPNPSDLHAPNDPAILNALKSGDSAGFNALLSEDGRRSPARNSSLLTYYDSKGNLISPDASVQQRVLHGDRGSIKR